MKDEINSLSAVLSYSIFPAYNAITRSISFTNDNDNSDDKDDGGGGGGGDMEILQASSFCLDMRMEEGGLDMIQLSGDWSREAEKVRRKVEMGIQG